tara:strand:- start:1703 stop:2323 length:621 start_codon:yes stop_codon:yes gene_type:complete
MKIEIKKSLKPVNYNKALNFLEKRVIKINENNSNELLWILNHPSTYTAGSNFKKKEILDNNIRIIKCSRGGKITWHGPGQLVFYFVLDLKKRNKDIRLMIRKIEDTIIDSLNSFKINSYSDRKNIGIWVNQNSKKKKIAAIGIKIKKWIAYHGFTINVNNKLEPYNKIMPCGINHNLITTLMDYKKQNYKNLRNTLIENFIKNFEN